MRVRLASAPAWFWAAFQGVFFAGWLTVWSVSDGAGWQKAVIHGAVIGLLYALVICLTTRWERRAETTILGAMSAEQRREVLRAAITGAPPGDPALQPVAVAIVRNRLDEYDRQRTLTLAVFAVLLALSALLAVTGALWYLAAAALFGWALIWTVRYPGQLTRRLAMLEVAALPPPPEKTPLS